MEHDLSNPIAMEAYIAAIWEARTLVLYCDNREQALIKLEAWYARMRKRADFQRNEGE